MADREAPPPKRGDKTPRAPKAAKGRFLVGQYGLNSILLFLVFFLCEKRVFVNFPLLTFFYQLLCNVHLKSSALVIGNPLTSPAQLSDNHPQIN